MSARRRRPTSPTERGLFVGFAAILGVALLAGYLLAAVSAYRFHHFAVTVDAAILSSDAGCFGPAGGGTGMGTKSTITYLVVFPYGAGTHRTHVVRPCQVVPPDFGRGRGSIWVQYDRDHPDRIRVLNDHQVEANADYLSIALIGYLVIGAVFVIRTKLPH